MPVNTVDKLEKEAAAWLESVTGEQLDNGKTFQENLKDGTILCKAFNASFVEMKVKYTHSAMPFKQMENIATFLHALSKLQNFRSFDLFSTVDLYEGKNMSSVTRCILSCKRIAEKEALSRGIETLKIEETTEIQKAEEEEEPTEVQVEEAEEENATEVESFEEINSAEPVDQPDEQALEESFEEIEHETVDPEIILIDSPVFADDESEPHFRDNRESNEEFEEYETFTMENPGTFEIHVTDQ